MIPANLRAVFREWRAGISGTDVALIVGGFLLLAVLVPAACLGSDWILRAAP